MKLPTGALVLLLLFAGCHSFREPTVFSRVPDARTAQARMRTWTQLPNRRTGTVSAASFSMWPTLRGHEVTLQTVYRPGMLLVRGQIVIFDRGDRANVIHRVWDFDGYSAFIAGDNCPGSDGWIPGHRIKAIVVVVIVIDPPAVQHPVGAPAPSGIGTVAVAQLGSPAGL